MGHQKGELPGMPGLLSQHLDAVFSNRENHGSVGGTKPLALRLFPEMYRKGHAQAGHTRFSPRALPAW